MRPYRSFAHLPRVSLAHLALLAASACALAGVNAQADQAPMASPPPGWVWQGTWQDGRWYGQWMPGTAATSYGTVYGAGAPVAYPPSPPGAQSWANDPEIQRMVDRCRNYHHDSVAGGAVIGGVVGGAIGNRVVSGDRLAGTIGGAAVGAVAGATIDRAGKRARDRDCEAFYNRHPEFAQNAMPYAQQAGVPVGYGAPVGYGTPTGYGTMPYGAIGYAPVAMAPVTYMMVPVAQPVQAAPVETSTVTTEYVDEPRSRLVPSARHRVAPRRAAPHRKDKRVYTGS